MFKPTGVFWQAEYDIPVPALYFVDNTGQYWSITTNDSGTLIPTKIPKHLVRTLYINDSLHNTTSWQITIDTSGNLHAAPVAHNPQYSCAIFLIATQSGEFDVEVESDGPLETESSLDIETEQGSLGGYTTVIRITPTGVLVNTPNIGLVQNEFFGFPNTMLLDFVAYTWLPDLTRQWCAIRIANRASSQAAVWPVYNFPGNYDVIGPPPLPPIQGMIVQRLKEQPELEPYFPGY